MPEEHLDLDLVKSLSYLSQAIWQVDEESRVSVLPLVVDNLSVDFLIETKGLYILWDPQV